MIGFYLFFFLLVTNFYLNKFKMKKLKFSFSLSLHFGKPSSLLKQELKNKNLHFDEHAFLFIYFSFWYFHYWIFHSILSLMNIFGNKWMKNNKGKHIRVKGEMICHMIVVVSPSCYLISSIFGYIVISVTFLRKFCCCSSFFFCQI